MTGEADMSIAAIVPVLILFDMGAPLRLTNVRFMTRMPRPIVTYDKIVRPFPPNVWIVFVVMSSCFAAVIYAIHKVHSLDGITNHQLVKKENLTLNLLLFPITKIVEPDALPWFEKWSSGKYVYFLWMTFCTFIVAFYTSNLRAHLVYIDYEKAPQDLKDIYERGARVYMHDNAARLRYE